MSPTGSWNGWTAELSEFHPACQRRSCVQPNSSLLILVYLQCSVLSNQDAGYNKRVLIYHDLESDGRRALLSLTVLTGPIDRCLRVSLTMKGFSSASHDPNSNTKMVFTVLEWLG